MFCSMRAHRMTEELDQLLKNLKLRRILEIYDEQLRAAEKDDLTRSLSTPRDRE